MLAFVGKVDWYDYSTKTFFVVPADKEKIKKKKEKETEMETLEMKEFPGKTAPGKWIGRITIKTCQTNS